MGLSLEDRNKILNKHTELFKNLLSTISYKKPYLILDEIHKYKDWKNLVKGFYDKFGENIEFIITGSAKLNIYKKGSDSLMPNGTLYKFNRASVIGI
ncbi:MAG: AAA family ATPase [Rickettsia aeschlimannii]